MKKDFITVAPDSGNSGTNVQVTVDPNAGFKSRSSSLNISSNKGNSVAVNVNQIGIPWFCTIGMATYNFFDNGETRWIVNWLQIPSTPPTINSDGSIKQPLTLPRKRFPIGTSGTDIMTEQYLTFSFVALDKLADDRPVYVTVNNKSVSLSRVKLTNGYSLFKPKNEEDPSLLINSSTQSMEVKISFDDEDSYQLMYEIRA